MPIHTFEARAKEFDFQIFSYRCLKTDKFLFFTATKFYTGMLRPERPTRFSFICHSVLRYPFRILSTDELYTFHVPSLKHYFLLATVNVDCKTVCIFAYSSTREQSNKRSGTKLKTESETGERR